MNKAEFDFHAELNDFLPSEKKGQAVTYLFQGRPGIKDPIEAIGIPHPEVAAIVVNGRSVGFDYQLNNGDQVSAYPTSDIVDIAPLIALREKPRRHAAFILDVNLGKLARRLRLCGLDTKYCNNYDDRDVADLSVRENRIVLTRDRRLLHLKTIIHGYWVRASDPDSQLKEVLRRFDLTRRILPFHRCIECNGLIRAVNKADVRRQLEPLTRQYYEEFFRCSACNKVYWKGSHYEHMLSHLTHLLGKI